MSGECEVCGNHALECHCKSGKLCAPSHIDEVNPSHYKGNTMEAIDIIIDYRLNFCLGNAIKYILRAGKKASRETDLRKAIWYLQMELEKKQM